MNNSFYGKLKKLSLTRSSSEFVPPVEKHWVKADMILGNARLNCQGSGVCKITVRSNSYEQTCKCKKLPIWISFVNNDCLQIIISKLDLSSQIFRSHFANDQVEISQPFEIPKTIGYQLGFSNQVIISAKKYTLFQNKYFFFHYLNYQHSLSRLAG